MGKLSVKDLISIHNLTRDDIEKIFEKSLELREKLKKGEEHKELNGKTLAMIFEKRSIRTRTSFEVGMTQLGGHAIFLSSDHTHIGTGESFKDIAEVLSGYCDGIMARTYDHSKIIELAQYSNVPVINGLTNFNHPCQILADFLTILEHRGNFTDLKIAWIGDGNSVCHSFIYMCAKMEVDLAIATPEEYKPLQLLWDDIRNYKKSDIFWTIDPKEAIENAEIVVTDSWVSMGDPEYKDVELAKKKKEKFRPYQVNKELIDHANKDYYFMHCLPAYRNSEVTPEIIDGPRSLVYPEAHNRLHVQKGLLSLLMK
ncbi:MAG: ornithine carbamoyltransferase [Theionarchaea archaeon]|nr:ornithine carbamoyltransferase [Theionarchaea archaeon]